MYPKLLEEWYTLKAKQGLDIFDFLLILDNSIRESKSFDEAMQEIENWEISKFQQEREAFITRVMELN